MILYGADVNATLPLSPIPGFLPVVDDRGFFYAKSSSNRIEATSGRHWILDADDTLWEDHLHYERFIERLLNTLSQAIPGFDQSAGRAKVDDVERRTIERVGWGPVGFLISLQEAFEELAAQYGVSLPTPHDLFREVEQVLGSVPHIIINGARETINALRERGDRLILYTQGERIVQFDKIVRSDLYSRFDGICVVGAKDRDSILRLVCDAQLDPDRAIVVGNSLISDIKPAIEAGLRAIHFANPNSWKVVNDLMLPEGAYREIRELSELSAVTI